MTKYLTQYIGSIRLSLNITFMVIIALAVGSIIYIHHSTSELQTTINELRIDPTITSQLDQKFGYKSLSTLQEKLKYYQLFSILINAFIIVITLFIGLVFLKNRVFRRLHKLREVMELQASDIEASLPGDFYGDEISDITAGLEKFIFQKEQNSEKLKKVLISLNEAQELAQIGSCERNGRTQEWHWSAGFYHIIGYTPDELPANEPNFWKVIHPKDKLQLELFLNTLSSSTQLSEIEFDIIPKDSEPFTVMALWKLADDSPHIQHGTIQNINDRKRIEENLLKVRKKESVSILAGGIAHDFNNLLTGILGNMALVSKLIADNTQAAELLLLAEKAAIRARDLTNKLLTFSTGGSPVTSVTHLPQLLKETCEFALSGSNVNCEYFFEEPLWPIDMDTPHINQIVQNLVVNADQAMPEGGTIIVTCTNTEIPENHANDLPPGFYVKLTFSDSGEGIPYQHLEKVFDPYYTTKGFYTNKGSGLGLAIVQSVVNKHGGSIEVNSQMNRGTEFIIHIPAIPYSFSPKNNEEKPDIQSGVGLVIVMDDEEIVRDVAREMLEELGYTVHTTINGNETLEVYDSLTKQGEIIHCVIMDLTIPGGMGGKETVHQLLKKHPSAKVIVSSGYTTDPVMENYKLYGFSEIIIKPYNLNDMSSVVARMTQNN